MLIAGKVKGGFAGCQWYAYLQGNQGQGNSMATQCKQVYGKRITSIGICTMHGVKLRAPCSMASCLHVHLHARA